MTALADKRGVRVVRFSMKEMAAVASDTYYQGALICLDTTGGLVRKGQASTGIVPIGTCAESKTLGASGGTVLVDLHREITAIWFANATAGDAIASTDIGDLAYVLDDQTVASNDATNTRSVAGRIWDVSATKGVLVELVTTADHKLGGLDV